MKTYKLKTGIKEELNYNDVVVEVSETTSKTIKRMETPDNLQGRIDHLGSEITRLQALKATMEEELIAIKLQADKVTKAIR